MEGTRLKISDETGHERAELSSALDGQRSSIGIKADEEALPSPKPVYERQAKPTAKIMLFRARSESQMQVQSRPNGNVGVPRSKSMSNLEHRSAYNLCIGQTVLVHENAQGKETAVKRVEEFDNLLKGI